MNVLAAIKTRLQQISFSLTRLVWQTVEQDTRLKVALHASNAIPYAKHARLSVGISVHCAILCSQISSFMLQMEPVFRPVRV